MITKDLTPVLLLLGFAPDVTLAVESNRTVSQVLQQRIEMLEKRLKERVNLRSEYRLLKTTPGIGEIAGHHEARGVEPG